MKKVGVFFLSLLSVDVAAPAQSYPTTTTAISEGELRRPQLSDTDILSRIESIERNMVALQKQVYAEARSTGGGAINNAVVNAQFDELYQQLKSIRGDIEQLQFESAKLNEKFVKFSADIEYRLNELSQAKKVTPSNNLDKKLKDIDEQLGQQSSLQGSDQKALESKANQAQERSKAAASSTKGKSADDIFQNAYALLKERKYDSAAKMFQEFIDKNPNHSSVGAAYFWLGETDFQKGNYNQAAIKYLKGYQQGPKGNKAADNLLKLGESLTKLGKRKEACLSLIKLKKEFPNAANSLKKKADDQITSLGCK